MSRNFGSLGGIIGGRARRIDDEFENAVDRALGPRMRANRATANAMWCALANVSWTRANGDTASYSFRAAGDLVSAIVGQGTDYMDFYCCGSYAVVTDEIAEAMEAEGWKPDDPDADVEDSL